MADWQPSTALGSAVWTAGFSYDPAQDIIYSRMDALQRKLGYAYAYDAAALLGISAVIDCEPIFFDYGGKHWMIELWKGQYGLETGCEVGVYTRTIESHPSPVYQLLDAALGTRPDAGAPSHNLFYDCADDSHMLDLSLTLHRNGQPLFSRGPEKHWWLTGFKWGVLSRPEELAVDISIGFPDGGMRQAFEGALRARGYPNIQASGNTVSFRFERPFSRQPRDTPPGLAYQVMQANARVVDAYRGLGFRTNDPNKVQADFLLITGLEILRLSDVYGRVAARLGVEIAKVGDYVVNVLTGFFGVAKQLVEEWFSGALRDLSAWVLSVQSSLGLTMDYGCVVEIDNRAGRSDLLRQSVRVDEGAYGVDPPQWIPKGEVGRFVMHDAKLQPTGSGGSVTYRYCTESFQAQTVTMAYSDPFGFWARNSASVSGGPFRLQARTTGDWSSSVPAQGHPLYVRCTTVN
jgi:Domain of unknown function (DUF4474)